MLFQIQVDLDGGLPTHAGYAIPFVEQALKQLKECISPRLDFVEVLGAEDSALISESADTVLSTEERPPGPRRVNMRMTVERAEFDHVIRSSEDIYEQEIRFGVTKK